jgi:predicted DCC family thiol-disulfide oxidoreductase YuxK
VLVEESGHISVRSEAVLRALRRLGGAWSLLSVFAVVPRPVRDWAYDLFARWRYRLFGRYDTCPLPPPEVRDRFLS